MGVYTRSWLKLFLPAHHKSPEDNSYPTISAILTKPLRLYRVSVIWIYFLWFALIKHSTHRTSVLYILKKQKTITLLISFVHVTSGGLRAISSCLCALTSNSAGTTRMLHAAGSQLQTVEQRRDTAAVSGARGARGVGVGAVRNSPGREHHWTKCGLEFNSFSLNGSVSRERCWTQRCLGIICGENAYANCGAAVARKTQPWLKHAQRPRLRSLGRRDVDVPLLGFLFLTFSCTRLHLTEPWACDEGVRFLETSWVSETQSAVTRAGRGVLHNFDPSIFHVIAS